MQVSLNSRVESLTSPITMPEPVSFGFEDMVKAKAKADAEFAAEIERRIAGKTSGGGAYRSSSAGTDALQETVGHKCTYDNAVAAELTALTARKRKKNDR